MEAYITASIRPHDSEDYTTPHHTTLHYTALPSTLHYTTLRTYTTYLPTTYVPTRPTLPTYYYLPGRRDQGGASVSRGYEFLLRPPAHRRRALTWPAPARVSALFPAKARRDGTSRPPACRTQKSAE